MPPSKDNLVGREDIERLHKLIDHLAIDEVRLLSKLLENWEKRDQRRHPREKCRIITEYVVNDQSYKGIIRNISLGGTYIETRHSFPVNQEILQTFFFPNFEIPIQSKSRIIWTSPKGFAVKFQIIDDA